jgi:hypothetical protein
MTARFCTALLVLFVAAGVPAAGQQAPTPAGTIKVASGQAFVVRNGTAIPATVGQAVFEADSLRTGTDGRLGVTMKDDTRISIGAASEARVQRFVFVPAEGRLAFVFTIARGVAAYVSGQIAKLAPDAVRLESPAAIIGVRGTSLAFRVGP